ncbi:hypothetical protein DFH09DRAFT_1038901 [Mycena vulgaris]|nr:hypothetical protein DFH09DRAFT_1038901 [Mycena vulgaris]
MSTTWENIEGEILAIVKLVGKEGAGDDIGTWILKLQADVKANEPGTLAYEFGRHGDTFTTWERFANEAALQAHVKNSLLQEFTKAELLAEPISPLFYTPFGAFPGSV